MNYGKSSMGAASLDVCLGMQNGSAWREGMGNVAGGAPGMDKTPFAIAVDGNHEAMAQLHNLLTHLEKRLSPLVSPDVGRPEPANCAEPVAISQIVGQIEGNTLAIYMACNRVQELINRLTV